MFGNFLSKPAKSKSGHILLVEDDRIIAATEVKLLKKLGYAVTLLTSGRDAVDFLNSGHDEINLVLMDIDLGHGIDGTATAREILKDHDLPILFLSGVSDPECIERVDDVFSYGFVVKGSDISILDASIKMAYRLHDANRVLKTNEKELLLLSNAIESTVDAVAISGPDAVLQYVNPAFLKMWDYSSREDVVGKPASDFWNEPEKASFVAQSVLMKGGWSGELTARSRDGACFTVDVSSSLVKDQGNNPVGIIASFRSNIARKLADESVLENEERFRSLFDNALEGIYQTTPDGRYINMNPAFASMFGYSSPEEMIISITDIGRQVYVNQDDREKLKKLLQENGLVKNYEAEVYKKDGSKFWISINARLVRGENGKLDRFEGTNIDITERKIADERLEEQKIKLLETNKKLESLNRELTASGRDKELLLKEINHRVRNNLSMISGILFLESEKLKDAATRNFFNDVISRINSMSTVYDRLYQFPDLQNINLAEYIKTLAASIYSSFKPADRRIGINVMADDIRLDVKRSSLLGLILNELIANSLRHAYPQQKEGTVNVVLKEDGGSITLAVSDDGCGMPPGYDEAVSTGLPLVRMLARQAGGTFELHGETGTAAVVSFKR